MINNLIAFLDETQVTGSPPGTGTDYFWGFVPGAPSTVGVTISNPNDVPMNITWTDFPGIHFTGPPALVSIPAHGSANFYVHCDGASDVQNTTGTWSTSGGSGALTGEADSS